MEEIKIIHEESPLPKVKEEHLNENGEQEDEEEEEEAEGEDDYIGILQFGKIGVESYVEYAIDKQRYLGRIVGLFKKASALKPKADDVIANIQLLQRGDPLQDDLKGDDYTIICFYETQNVMYDVPLNIPMRVRKGYYHPVPKVKRVFNDFCRHFSIKDKKVLAEGRFYISEAWLSKEYLKPFLKLSIQDEKLKQTDPEAWENGVESKLLFTYKKLRDFTVRVKSPQAIIDSGGSKFIHQKLIAMQEINGHTGDGRDCLLSLKMIACPPEFRLAWSNFDPSDISDDNCDVTTIPLKALEKFKTTAFDPFCTMIRVTRSGSTVHPKLWKALITNKPRQFIEEVLENEPLYDISCLDFIIDRLCSFKDLKNKFEDFPTVSVSQAYPSVYTQAEPIAADLVWAYFKILDLEVQKLLKEIASVANQDDADDEVKKKSNKRSRDLFAENDDDEDDDEEEEDEEEDEKGEDIGSSSADEDDEMRDKMLGEMYDDEDDNDSFIDKEDDDEFAHMLVPDEKDEEVKAQKKKKKNTESGPKKKTKKEEISEFNTLIN